MVRLLSVLCCVAVCVCGEAAESQPNVIFIMADDLGVGELGCYGQTKIKTPAIDKLARQGVRFTQFYSGSPVCAPARCVLMTGKSPSHAYIRNNGDPKLPKLKEKYGWEFSGQNPIPASEVTIAEVLKTKGYATGAMGKWGLGHVGTTGDPNKQGFDLFFGYLCQRHAHDHYPRFLWRNGEKVRYPGNDRQLTGETYSQDEFTREALEFIRDHQSEPFFLYLPAIISHLSIQVPEASLAKYEGKLSEAPYQHNGYHKHPTPRAGYAAMVTHLDDAVGQIVDLVDELGLAENTVIVFTSDNGPAAGRDGGTDSTYFESTAGGRGRKGSVYEGGIRVPMVVRWPGHVPEGTTSDTVSAFWDILPTICDLTGASVPPESNGLSLLPSFTGEGDQKQHEHLIWEFAGYGGQQAIRMGDWKGVRRDMKKGNRELALFNLADDPKESRNVAEEHPEIVRRMKKLLATDRTDSQLFPFANSFE